MRVENIMVKMVMSVPVGIPDVNGTIYSKEAIEKAFTPPKVIPICIRTNAVGENFVVGSGSVHDITFDDKQNECKVTIEGLLYFGGTECTVNSIEDGAVSDFEINAFGISC